ncbi:MAG: DUF1801 domain-containing protein [Cyclobacteriaceae bacterium]|nr:DUF1801 domain-containing protein [Cyclobacteriaceae bacterium]
MAEIKTPEDYIKQLDGERKEAMQTLRTTILSNIPPGFKETISYGMIGYVVPHSIYPKGYHVNQELPLPFINIASQKNFIALYHMGLYAEEELLKWFKKEYSRQCTTKLDMGKSCIRFKKPDKIPLNLIAELVAKISCEEWIELYEKSIQSSRKRTKST